MGDTTKNVKSSKRKVKSSSSSKEEEPPKRPMMDPSIKTQEVLVDTTVPPRLMFWKMNREIFRSRLHWMDEQFRGPLAACRDINPDDPSPTPKDTELYPKRAERASLKKECKECYLSSGVEWEKVKADLKLYNRCVNKTPMDGNCLYTSVLQQVSYPRDYTSDMLRKQTAYYCTKYPEVIYPYIQTGLRDQCLKSYLINQWEGRMFGDITCLAIIGIMWNIAITVITPHMDPIDIFHDKKESPDVVIIHNGRMGSEGHFTSTVGLSKKWAPVTSDKAAELKEITDPRMVSNCAREQYKVMKIKQVQEQYDYLVSEMITAVDDINGIKELHARAVERYTDLDNKRETLLQKMKDADINCSKYFEAMVRQPDPLDEFDGATLLAILQPSTVRLSSGAAVTQSSGYVPQGAEGNSLSGSSVVTPYCPGGPGIGSRQLKNLQRFSCVDCNRRFTKKFDMMQHRKDTCQFRTDKTKRFNCTFCDKTYSMKVTLKEHTAAKHVKQYIYFCKCGAGFYYNRLAVTHRAKCSKVPKLDSPPSTPERSTTQSLKHPNSPERMVVDGENADNGADSDETIVE